jgi:osmotically-inducible protein OsmY
VRSIDRLGFPGAAQNVRCQDAGDRVVLEGRVDSYYLKQVCQTIAAKVPGVRRVENRLTVTAQ